MLYAKIIADVTDTPIYDGISDPSSPNIGDLNRVALNVLDILTYIAGSAAILAIVVSGLMIVTSAGNSARVEKGKKYLLYSLYGVALITGAHFVVKLVINLAKGAFI